MKTLIRAAILLAAVSLAAQQTPTVSLASLTQSAESGDPKAQFELGRAYEDGKGVPQDDSRAVEWFRKSAEQGNAQAQNSLGVMFAQGRGVTRDREEAVRWYRKAAKQGQPDAIYNIAISYYNGEGQEQNISMACTWMMLAQHQGGAQAGEALKHIEEEMNNRFDRCKYDLAGMFEKGEEVPRDLPAALGLYTEAAQAKKKDIFAGNAQLKLCQIYASGEGMQPDYRQARLWCKESNSQEANLVLGRMAEKGQGSPKDLKEAMEYYRKAATHGGMEPFMEAGRLRMESGTHEGLKQAYFWYAIAAKYKYKGADEKLREVTAKLSEKEIANEAKHVRNYEEASKVGELKKH